MKSYLIALMFLFGTFVEATPQYVVQTGTNYLVSNPPGFWTYQNQDAAFSNAVNSVAAGAGITNGLATTNFVTAYAYPTSNPSLFVTASVTNGLVGAAITNGLATTNFVNTAIVGFVTASITNGLATTNYATIQAQNFAQQATNGLSLPSTNGFVTSSITNGLATTNYVNNATNGLLSAIPVSATNQFLVGAVTNGFVLSQNGSLTNPSINIGSGTSIFIGGTNAAGAELIVTNANPSGWAFLGVQFNNGNGTTNYNGIWGNNNGFAPGNTWIGSTNDGGYEYNGAGNQFIDRIGSGSLIIASRASTNGAVNTNAIINNTAANFNVPIQVNGVNVLTNSSGGVTNNQIIYSPILKIWPDVAWVLGDSKSCEFRTNANTWSVHGGYPNPLAISLYPPYTTNSGIYTYTNGAAGVTVTNGGSWAVYFTNRMATNFGKATILNNSLAQSGLQMGSYLGTPYVARGTKWIPPYTDPNGGDPLLYLATNTAYSGRPWVLVYGGQNDFVSTNVTGLWQTMTNLYAALRAQGKIVIAGTITIAPNMFQVAATPNWTQLTALGTNVLQFNSLLMSNQYVCDAVVDVQGALSNRVTSGTGWITGMTTNWWDGTHPIDQEADFEASVWVNMLDTNVVFWANVASYQSPSYQLSQWAKINPTNLTRFITNNNATPFTNAAVGQFADALSVLVSTVSARVNVGGNNDAIIRLGGAPPSDTTSAIFGMAGGGSYWFADATGGETVVYAKPGFQILTGDGNGGGRRATTRTSDKLFTVQTNMAASWTITATNGFVCPSNTWNVAFTNGMGLGDWRFGNSNGIPMKVWLTPAGSWIWSTNF